MKYLETKKKQFGNKTNHWKKNLKKKQKTKNLHAFRRYNNFFIEILRKNETNSKKSWRMIKFKEF